MSLFIVSLRPVFHKMPKLWCLKLSSWIWRFRVAETFDQREEHGRSTRSQIALLPSPSQQCKERGVLWEGEKSSLWSRARPSLIQLVALVTQLCADWSPWKHPVLRLAQIVHSTVSCVRTVVCHNTGSRPVNDYELNNTTCNCRVSCLVVLSPGPVSSLF